MKANYFSSFFIAVCIALSTGKPALAADNLRLNPHLDYSSDSVDGPLITGSNMHAGIEGGRPNYILIYGEGCYNSKRQARRTVSLYEKYRDRIHFVVVDLDTPLSPAQQQLVDRYFHNSIPHVIVLDAQSNPIYNQAGEQDEMVLSRLFEKALH
jgi:hypothetical protein